jgi:hypothetical protein
MIKGEIMDRKKKVAAMAAVIAHIKNGEAIQDCQKNGDDSFSRPAESATAFSNAPNLWGLTGRQAMMQANTMMQLRMFR